MANAPTGDSLELTEALIKYATGQFDTALVHSASLCMLSIVRIAPNAFSNCGAYLTELNLSRNALTSADGLQSLASLQVLDISHNAIASIDGLSKCTSLQVLHAEGNRLGELQLLQPLDVAFLPKLRSVHLQNRDGTDANPLCADRAAYVGHMSLHFGHVRCIDGHYLCRTDMQPLYVDAGGDAEVALPPSAPWVSESYFGNVFLEASKIGAIPEKAFATLVGECRKALQQQQRTKVI